MKKPKCSVCGSLDSPSISFFYIKEEPSYLFICVPCYTSLKLKNINRCLICGSRKDTFIDLCTVHHIGDRIIVCKVCKSCIDSNDIDSNDIDSTDIDSTDIDSADVE